MNRTIVLIVLVALVGAGAGAWVGARLAPTRGIAVGPVAGASVASARPGDRFLDASLPDLDGRTRSIGEFVGQPVLLNFWATWCGPCIEEMPLLDDVQREVGLANLRVVGIAQDDPAAVAEFLRARPVSFPILLDVPGPADLSVRYGNVRNVLPFSVLIAADGSIVAQRSGSFDRDTLEAWLAPLR